MIPETQEFFSQDETIDNYEVLPTRTYKLDFENKRIIGTVQDGESVLQFVKKVLSTDKYAYEIYDWYYGNDLKNLAGKAYEYIIVEIPRIVEEALLVDDRITSVENYRFEQTSVDSMTASFTVRSIYGDIPYEMEVQL